MRLVANLAITELCRKLKEPWHMGTHLRVLSESIPMNTNMTGLDSFQKSLRPCALNESSLSMMPTHFVKELNVGIVTCKSNSKGFLEILKVILKSFKKISLTVPSSHHILHIIYVQ